MISTPRPQINKQKPTYQIPNRIIHGPRAERRVEMVLLALAPRRRLELFTSRQ